MDPRFERAQQLFFEVLNLRQKGQPETVRLKFAEMARLHQERALELLDAGNLDGWMDLFAAITAWGEAGHRSEADRLVEAGRRFASACGDGRENLEGELRQYELWLDSLLPHLPLPAANGAQAVLDTHRV
jgi:hypothetical protein